MKPCHPIIGWRSSTRGLLPIASSGDPSNLTNGLTYGPWSPTTTPATLEWTIPAGFDYVAIVGENLGIVHVERFDGLTWNSVGGLVGGDVRLVTFDPNTDTLVRLVFTTGSPKVHYVAIGEKLRMYRSLKGGHAPILLNRRDTIRPSRSDNAGVWTGRQFPRRAYKASLSFSAIPENWYRSEFQPFVEDAKSNPFFIVERPQDYPEEVAYCYLTGDPNPSHQDVTSRLNVTVDADGFRSISG